MDARMETLTIMKTDAIWAAGREIIRGAPTEVMTNAASALWSSTTVPFATANAVRLIGASSAGPAQGVAKTSTNPYIYCRRFI